VLVLGRDWLDAVAGTSWLPVQAAPQAPQAQQAPQQNNSGGGSNGGGPVVTTGGS
jgi:hypothetical protein